MLLIANLIAITRISLRVMVLEEEGIGTTSITIEGEEVDSIAMVVSNMEVSTLVHRQFRISLHKIFLLSTIRIKILLRVSRLIVHHVRFVGNLDMEP